MAVALIAGATGLVGNLLLDQLLSGEDYTQVIAVSRKPLNRSHAKLINRVVDFDHLDAQAHELKADDIFCCLGTTIRQAGSQEAFRKVDHEYPLQLARLTKQQGARQFLLITAMGSDKSSSIFYNRVKGEVEEAIGNVGFEAFHIFQPSMLLGDRIEQRAGESVGKKVMLALDFLIPKKYKAIEAIRVARGMYQVALRRQPGRHIHDSAELQDFVS
ncbi:MAG: oxidoreductase [Cyclobacteriaceae bacterium]|nr:oxidoreductase [Cyclobacteriaceae bacterium]